MGFWGVGLFRGLQKQMLNKTPPDSHVIGGTQEDAHDMSKKPLKHIKNPFFVDIIFHVSIVFLTFHPLPLEMQFIGVIMEITLFFY